MSHPFVGAIYLLKNIFIPLLFKFIFCLFTFLETNVQNGLFVDSLRQHHGSFFVAHPLSGGNGKR
jgi:hypothetical protein